MQSVLGKIEGNEINSRGRRKWNKFLEKLQIERSQKLLEINNRILDESGFIDSISRWRH